MHGCLVGSVIFLLNHCPSRTTTLGNYDCKTCLYSVELLNFIGQTLGLFCGCRILLPTLWRFHHHICQLSVRRQGRNAHFDACVRGFLHHIFGEENVTHCWTKFKTQMPDPRCMTPTNTCTSAYLGHNWSNGRSSWSNSALTKPVTDCLGGHSPSNLRCLQHWLQQWLFDYVDGTPGYTDHGLR